MKIKRMLGSRAESGGTGDQENQETPEEEDQEIRSSSTSQYRHLSFCQKICIVTKNKSYIFLVLALSSLFFLMSGVTYWMPTYFIKSLDIPRKEA